MHKEILKLIKSMNDPNFVKAGVIHWGSPIPSFGKLTTAKLATIGLNPSNREFVDESGVELDGPKRRFHTLRSLGIGNWAEANKDHYDSVIHYCFDYFSRNPYDLWFKKLDYIISGTSRSYYFPSGLACHLDLIPYATHLKWTELSTANRYQLLNLSSDFLGLLLNNSKIEVIVLNGQTVVNNLQKVSNVQLVSHSKKDWILRRNNSKGVMGYGYTGNILSIGNVTLNREIKVLGFNHNIQSSFGVTKQVQNSIRNWITENLMSI